MATVHNGFQPWSIPQPQLRKITAQQAQECKEGAKDIFTPLLADFLSDIKIAPDKCLCADMYSQHAVRLALDLIESIVGRKSPTHKKGKFQSQEITRAKAEITTLQKARDLIRTLLLQETSSEIEKERVCGHLKTLLDRLCRMGLTTVPRSLEPQALHQWSESFVPVHLENLKTYLKSQKEDLESKEKTDRLKWFLDPKKRGKWLDNIFASETSHCPNYALIPGSGEITYDPEKIKEIYLSEGTSFLRNKRSCPPPYDEKKAQKPNPPPVFKNRADKAQARPIYAPQVVERNV